MTWGDWIGVIIFTPGLLVLLYAVIVIAKSVFGPTVMTDENMRPGGRAWKP